MRLRPKSSKELAEEKKERDSEKADANYHWGLDWSDGFSGHDLNIEGYFLADEGVIRLYINKWYGDEIEHERPAASEAEAKAIFDFYVFKIILEENKGEDWTGPEVDPDSYSVLYQFNPTYFGQWFPLKGFIRLESDDREAREWPAKTLFEAEIVFQAYVWELDRTADDFSVLLQWWRWYGESELFCNSHYDVEVGYDDETTKTITGNDISEYLCQCIDDELTEIEDKE